jgi:hypothetical protein
MQKDIVSASIVVPYDDSPVGITVKGDRSLQCNKTQQADGPIGSLNATPDQYFIFLAKNQPVGHLDLDRSWIIRPPIVPYSFAYLISIDKQVGNVANSSTKK